MIIRMPCEGDIPEMKKLWQQAFGDTMECIDSFFATGYRQTHSRILWDDGLLGAIYWFDMSYREARYALLYALAIAEGSRGRGLGKRLMEQVCKDIEALGYTGAVLVPAGEHLYGFYNRLGFNHFGGAEMLQVAAGGEPVYLQKTDARHYLQDRSGFIWGEAFSAFVEDQCFLYRSGDIRLICYQDGSDIQEYTGPAELLPGILTGLGISTATVRMPGTKEKAAMCRMFQYSHTLPEYFGPNLD